MFLLWIIAQLRMDFEIQFKISIQIVFVTGMA